MTDSELEREALDQLRHDLRCPEHVSDRKESRVEVETRRIATARCLDCGQQATAAAGSER